MPVAGVPPPAFLRDYANWESLRRVFLTFDVDFAPEYMIRNVLDILDRHGVAATFFATHRSALLVDRSRDDSTVIALHPNLGPASTQGSSLEQIISRLKESYPGADGVRFHKLKYSYPDLVSLSKMAITWDVSSLRFNTPYLLPAWHRDLRMTLMTYCWEDGICENAGMPLSLENINLHSPGMKILNFHPMNVFVNGPDSRQRLRFLAENPELLVCEESVARRYRMPGVGAETGLLDVIAAVKQAGAAFGLVRDLAAAFRNTIAGA